MCIAGAGGLADCGAWANRTARRSRLSAVGQLRLSGVIRSGGRSRPPQFRSVGRSNRRAFDPHGWTGAAIANHSAIPQATASLESDVDDWIHLPAVTLAAGSVAVDSARG